MKVKYALDEEVLLPLDSVRLEGKLVIPENAKGIVVFSHGSGSSRFSPRNNYVAGRIQKGGMGTLLLDLLTTEEDLYYSNRFDINLLIERLLLVTNWLKEQPATKDLKVGYFGSSTGAASALGAAATLGSEIVRTVVSRGGRPDLAMPYLPDVKVPTLFIVGGDDYPVIEMNEEAFEQLGAEEKKMTVVEGATHLFEEPGKLEEVAGLSEEWFEKYLS